MHVLLLGVRDRCVVGALPGAEDLAGTVRLELTHQLALARRFQGGRRYADSAKVP